MPWTRHDGSFPATPGLAKAPLEQQHARLVPSHCRSSTRPVSCHGVTLPFHPGLRPDPLLHPRACKGEGKEEGLPCILRCRNADPQQVGLPDWTCRAVCVKVKGDQCGQGLSRPSHDQEVPTKVGLHLDNPWRQRRPRRGSPKARLTRCLPRLSSSPGHPQPTPWRCWFA